MTDASDQDQKIRLDKWLWAARFYRTRAKAKHAIDGGKVYVEGNRGKPGKEVQIDEVIILRQGWDEKTIVIKALSDQRRDATTAQSLYEETPDSINQRELLVEQRKAAGNHLISSERPNKRNRRLIHQFKDKNLKHS